MEEVEVKSLIGKLRTRRGRAAALATAVREELITDRESQREAMEYFSRAGLYESLGDLCMQGRRPGVAFWCYLKNIAEREELEKQERIIGGLFEVAEKKIKIPKPKIEIWLEKAKKKEKRFEKGGKKSRAGKKIRKRILSYLRKGKEEEEYKEDYASAADLYVRMGDNRRAMLHYEREGCFMYAMKYARKLQGRDREMVGVYETVLKEIIEPANQHSPQLVEEQ